MWPSGLPLGGDFDGALEGGCTGFEGLHAARRVLRCRYHVGRADNLRGLGVWRTGGQELPSDLSALLFAFPQSAGCVLLLLLLSPSLSQTSGPVGSCLCEGWR